MIVFVLETFSTIKRDLYALCKYRLSKLSGKYNRDEIKRENEKCKKDSIAFKGLDNIRKLLDYVLQFEGEPKEEVIIGIVKNNLYLLAHKRSGFVSNVVLNNLPQWETVVSLIKNGSGNVSWKIFNGFVDPVKKIPH